MKNKEESTMKFISDFNFPWFRDLLLMLELEVGLETVTLDSLVGFPDISNDIIQIIIKYSLESYKTLDSFLLRWC